jgi:hypothetical protein
VFRGPTALPALTEDVSVSINPHLYPSRKWLSKWKEYRKGRNGNGIADAKTEIGDKTVIEV